MEEPKSSTISTATDDGAHPIGRGSRLPDTAASQLQKANEAMTNKMSEFGFLNTSQRATAAEEESAKKLTTALSNNLSACFMKTEEWEKAATHAKNVLSAEPNNPKALFRRGTANIHLRRYEEAEMDLNRAEELSPTDVGIKKQLQLLHRKQKEYEQDEKKLVPPLVATEFTANFIQNKFNHNGFVVNHTCSGTYYSSYTQQMIRADCTVVDLSSNNHSQPSPLTSSVSISLLDFTKSPPLNTVLELTNLANGSTCATYEASWLPPFSQTFLRDVNAIYAGDEVTAEYGLCEKWTFEIAQITWPYFYVLLRFICKFGALRLLCTWRPCARECGCDEQVLQCLDR
ncbi:hypothetical protein EMCRGX_G032798 [Ephydatia muelleri]